MICSFCPRKLDFDPLAVPIPYHHSNLQSEEMIYYVSGNFGSRHGVEVGSITLHPSGLPHGPQPGLAEKALGMHETHELAVMCDTFHPLKLSTFARELDDGVVLALLVRERAGRRRADGRRRLRRRAHLAPLAPAAAPGPAAVLARADDGALPRLRARPRDGLGGRGAVSRRRRAGRCGSRRRKAASTSSRSTRRREPVVRKLLGFDFDLVAFSAWAAGEEVLAPLVVRFAGFRPTLAPDPFEMLVGAITAQQVSLFSAVAIRNRLVERLGERVGRVWAFPARERVAAASEEELFSLGFSRRKAEYVIGLARSDLDLAGLALLPDDDVKAQLTALRGPRRVDGGLVPGALPRSPARLAGRRPRSAQGRARALW